jgi:diketogulonate reductase-like aldo/keto reductase
MACNYRKTLLCHGLAILRNLSIGKGQDLYQLTLDALKVGYRCCIDRYGIYLPAIYADGHTGETKWAMPFERRKDVFVITKNWRKSIMAIL